MTVADGVQVSRSLVAAVPPQHLAVTGAADIAVLKCAPLGGVRRALAVADGRGRRGSYASVVSGAVACGSR